MWPQADCKLCCFKGCRCFFLWRNWDVAHTLPGTWQRDWAHGLPRGRAGGHVCQASGQLESNGHACVGLHLLPHHQTLWAALVGLPGGLASPLGAASMWHQQGSGAGRGRGQADSSPLSALGHVFRQGLQSFLHSSCSDWIKPLPPFY